MDDREWDGGEGDLKVTDRRRFTAEGEERPEGEAPGQEKVRAGEEGQPSGLEGASGEGAPPAIDFATFVLSLATSAQVHLGAVPNPATGKQERDLNLAKQTIDILGLLEEKTKGNLDENERRLLEHLLFDLRMMYVEAKKA